MQALDISTNVRYSITPCPDGVNLCVWETAKTTDVRTRPFLFKVNHRVTTREEAYRMLRFYIEAA
ncbi:hypothetical protein [Pantanalinema sp. GBBB05]|uniref:hypothetical protein n=1 Tax=Pantanalinema sp. GBBB05 TaxID=2604139 RepID=UPI001DC99564|nr:hypothetical protein [Pantanalinema sp. GBBB05]